MFPWVLGRVSVGELPTDESHGSLGLNFNTPGPASSITDVMAEALRGFLK